MYAKLIKSNNSKMYLRILFLTVLYSTDTYANYYDYEEESRLISSDSLLTPLLSFLTIPIIYFIFLALKKMIVFSFSDSDNSEIEANVKQLSPKEVKNKNLVRFIKRIIEAAIFIGITILLLLMNFYYHVIYFKLYNIDDDLFALGWLITPIWIIFQDLIKIQVRKGLAWYGESSKL